jgi:hypothetical protein
MAGEANCVGEAGAVVVLIVWADANAEPRREKREVGRADAASPKRDEKLRESPHFGRSSK